MDHIGGCPLWLRVVLTVLGAPSQCIQGSVATQYAAHRYRYTTGLLNRLQVGLSVRFARGHTT